MRRWPWAVRLAAAVFVLLPASSWARAHPDARLFDGTLSLDPGEAVTRPMALHFHRLVASWTVDDRATDDLAGDDRAGDDRAADGLWLLVVPAEAPGAARIAPAEAWFAAPLAGEGRLSHLIDCCLGIDYRHFLWVVRNDGDAPAGLRLRAWALHDEFAVVAARAESGALEVPLVLFAGLGAAALFVASRERRRAAASRPRGSATATNALRLAALLLAMSVAAASLLGSAGGLRYGGGPVDGMIAVLADLAVPGGPFGSRAAFLLAWLLLAHMAAIAAWIVAVDRGAHLRSRWAPPLGAVLAAVSLGGGVAMAVTYDNSLVPAALGLVLGAPLAVTVWQVRKSASSAASGR